MRLSILILLTCLFALGCSPEQPATFTSASRVLAINIPHKDMVAIQYIPGTLRGPTGITATFEDFDGEIGMSLLSGDQKVWKLEFVCSGKMRSGTEVQTTNLVTVTYPTPKNFSFPNGVKGTAWFLSDSELKDFYATHAEVPQ